MPCWYSTPCLFLRTVLCSSYFFFSNSESFYYVVDFGYFGFFVLFCFILLFGFLSEIFPNVWWICQTGASSLTEEGEDARKSVCHPQQRHRHMSRTLTHAHRLPVGASGPGREPRDFSPAVGVVAARFCSQGEQLLAVDLLCSAGDVVVQAGASRACLA